MEPAPFTLPLNSLRKGRNRCPPGPGIQGRKPRVPRPALSPLALTLASPLSTPEAEALPSPLSSPLPPPPEPGEPVPGSEARYLPYGEVRTPGEPVALTERALPAGAGQPHRG